MSLWLTLKEWSHTHVAEMSWGMQNKIRPSSVTLDYKLANLETKLLMNKKLCDTDSFYLWEHRVCARPRDFCKIWENGQSCGRLNNAHQSYQVLIPVTLFGGKRVFADAITFRIVRWEDNSGVSRGTLVAIRWALIDRGRGRWCRHKEEKGCEVGADRDVAVAKEQQGLPEERTGQAWILPQRP